MGISDKLRENPMRSGKNALIQLYCTRSCLKSFRVFLSALDWKFLSWLREHDGAMMIHLTMTSIMQFI